MIPVESFNVNFFSTPGRLYAIVESKIPAKYTESDLEMCDKTLDTNQIFH